MTPPIPSLGHVWTRYVAIGDSFTEGMSDADPDHPGQFVGWADRLAGSLDAVAAQQHVPFTYANLAIRGKLLDDVVGRQLESALALTPDLISMVGGGNDILRPGVDLDAIAAKLEDAVIRIRATGADVLLATPTDTRDAGLFKALRGRHGIHSANIFTIAQDHGCFVLNLWGMAALRDWRLWSDDRIHLTTEGHQRVALAALTALGHPSDTDYLTPLPPAPASGRRERWRANGDWALTHLRPWIGRRLRGRSSGDTVSAKRPELAPLRQERIPETPPTEHSILDR